jgi:hypothetical protein
MILASPGVRRVSPGPHFVVVTQAYPAELESTFRAYDNFSITFSRARGIIELTRHVVTTIVLFDVVHAIWPWALLRELANRLQACSFLRLLISLFPARRTIIVLLTSLAFMPRVFVNDAGFGAARNTCKDVALFATQVDLAAVACSAPSKVGCHRLLACLSSREKGRITYDLR